MKKKAFQNKNTIIAIIMIVVFSLISAICLIMQGDDFVWYFVNQKNPMKKIEAWDNPNGRYLTNEITVFMNLYPVIKNIIFVSATSIFMILLSCLSDFEKKSKVLKYAFTFILVLLMPKEIYAETFNWVSGFTNYVLSMLFTLVYVFFTFKVAFNKNYSPSFWYGIAMAVLGLAGALCVEHITIYNILFGIFAIILIYRLRKKVFSSNILYLIFSIVGTIIMFSSEQYAIISESSSADTIGMRRFEFNPSDIFMQIYLRIVPNYSKQFFIIHILISAIFLYFYYNAEKENWDKSKKKYSKICIAILVLYATYTVFVNCFVNLVVFDYSMKIRAIETAFAFIYFIALIYLSLNLLEGNSKIRIVVYIVSTVLVVLPFVVVNPVTARCFFVDYIFWVLIVAELFFACYEKSNFLRSGIIEKLLCSCAVFIGGFMCNINISNKYYNEVRIDYIKEQVDAGARNVQIITLPYSEYAYDNLDKEDMFALEGDELFSEEKEDLCYAELFFEYYDIEIDKESFRYTLINVMDYSTH